MFKPTMAYKNKEKVFLLRVLGKWMQGSLAKQLIVAQPLTLSRVTSAGSILFPIQVNPDDAVLPKR